MFSKGYGMISKNFPISTGKDFKKHKFPRWEFLDIIYLGKKLFKN